MRTPGERDSCESREVANVRVVKGKGAMVEVEECDGDKDGVERFTGGR